MYSFAIEQFNRYTENTISKSISKKQHKSRNMVQHYFQYNLDQAQTWETFIKDLPLLV